MSCPGVVATLLHRSRPVERKFVREPAFRVSVLVAILLTVAMNTDPIHVFLPQQQLHTLLTLGAAGITSCAVVAAYLIARMDGSRSAAGIAAGVAVYGLVVMPATVVAFNGGGAAHLMQMVRLVGAGVFLVLMACALLPARSTFSSGWRAAVLGSVLTVVLAVLITALPVVDMALTASRAPTIVLAGWCVLAVCYFVFGLLNWRLMYARIGAGLAVIASSHFVLLGSDSLVLSASTRLLGALILMLALFQRLREVMRDAVLQAQRIAELTAERDHEMQNVLAGLDGMTHVLSFGGAEERAMLSEALSEEIARLRGLLERRSETPGCEVEPVLSRLVSLRRSKGLDVELNVEPELRTTVPASVLAQVVTNLLANCERHAPGARVWISASNFGRSACVYVHDNGPGLTPDVASHAFERGVGDPESGGSGLGLYVSSQLLSRAGGSLKLMPAKGGCVAAVVVPA